MHALPPVSHRADTWDVTCWGKICCGVIWLYEIIAVFGTWANMGINLPLKHYIYHKNHVWVCVCVRRRSVIRWPYFISAWSPFGMSPTHSAIIHDSIATDVFYLALLHQPHFSFLIYWGPEHNLNDRVICPAWRLLWTGKRVERRMWEEKVITALLLDYWFSRLKDTIRDSWALYAEGPLAVYL